MFKREVIFTTTQTTILGIFISISFSSITRFCEVIQILMNLSEEKLSPNK